MSDQRKNNMHPEVERLLKKYKLSWEMLQKQGRPPMGVTEKRSSVVTELHKQGYMWKEMAQMLDKPISFIQRNTQAVGNEESHQNRVKNGYRTSQLNRGRECPKTSKRMKKMWENGYFDFHKGREISEETRAKLKKHWSDPDLRANQSQMMKECWQDPEYKANLLEFHRSEEERARRSRLQSKRMAENPEKWSRGNGEYLKVTKCLEKTEIYVRSSYEKAAVKKLEGDDLVLYYKYETRLKLESGRYILPDFLVTYQDREQPLLVEVKASWVLDQPEDSKVQKRLKLAKKESSKRDWKFIIWTEKDGLDGFI